MYATTFVANTVCRRRKQYADFIKPAWAKRRNSQNVRLSSRPDRMDALRINTSRPSEYFPIEYRRRPDSGDGSVPPPFSGLAIYHVL
jgi:hypothetical protein